MNTYKPSTSYINVDKTFKPGFRFQYFNFINHFLLKKRSYLKTDLLDLIRIYKICELLHK